MKKRNLKQAREELRQWLVKWTKCDIQGGFVNGKEKDFGWSCGTCTCDLLGKLGLDPKTLDYHRHNQPVDRINEVWRAILQIRETKL